LRPFFCYFKFICLSGASYVCSGLAKDLYLLILSYRILSYHISMITAVIIGVGHYAQLID
jgi:hypothetical protein